MTTNPKPNVPKVDLEQYGIWEYKGRKYENISYVIALVYNLSVKEIGQYLAKFGIGLSKYNVLLALEFQNNGEGLSQVQLADHLIVTPGNITKIIDSLIKEGYVTRVVNPKSRRENIIKITQAGKDLVEQIWPGYDELVSGIVNKLPKKYHETFAQALYEWFTNLKDPKQNA